MIALKENEKILMTLHKHWLVIVGRLVFILMLGAIPLVGFFYVRNTALLVFALALYWLVLLLLFFIEWLDYWLDAWIITDLRIIDIEQKGLFHREASEFVISRVQDVTITVPGMLATFFKFGNLTIQTAGDMSFTAYSVPNLNEAKNLILAQATKQMAANN